MRMRGWWIVGLATLWLGAAAPLPGADSAGTRKDLARTRERIRTLETQRRRDQQQQRQLEERLRNAEQAAADARKPLRELARELAAVRSAERKLARDIAAAEAELAAGRRQLAGQLQRAWVAGPATPLRLALVPGEDSAAASHRLAWIGYVARRQEQLVAGIDATRADLATKQAAAAARARELVELEARQRQALARLDSARRDRKQVLASLEQTLASRDAQLRSLRTQADALTRLLRQLERAARARPAPRAAPAEGKPLPPGRWPVDGKLLADYGQARAGQLRWDGVLIAAPAGTDVRAARAGRVVYADWLPGLGQLLVIDHGRGYLSLYGHNQDLLKGVGADVESGEAVARVGDSGGQSRPALYFEVRRNGRPQNPRQWVK